MLKLVVAGDPRIELGLPVPESYGLKTKQYFMNHLGLFCSGINHPLDHTGLLKYTMLQEVVRFSVDPVVRSHPSICGR